MSGDWDVSDISPIPSPHPADSEDGNDASDAMLPENIENGNPRKQHNDAKFKWLSGPWPLKTYEGNLPINERKGEWFRFRDQFDRIISCKPEVDPITKLTGFKLHAGTYLLSIIEVQEKSIKEPCVNIFESVKEALNIYFNKMCDPSKERMKFREMHMGASEIFEDWILRLENQAKFCEFTHEQRQEEFLQAVSKRSIPEIGTKLYEFQKYLKRMLKD